MGDLQFALLREGTSDDGLVAHIRHLLVRAGAEGVVGAARQYRGPTVEKLEQVLAEPVAPALIFVHRDADNPDPTARRDEIADAAAQLGCTDRVVAVVPVQELEAWLLVDGDAIRTAVGNPRGRAQMDLPSPAQVEAASSPKELLRAACVAASEKSGARRKKEVAQFNLRRATLLERLDIDGEVTRLPSWQRFIEDLNAAASRLLERN